MGIQEQTCEHLPEPWISSPLPWRPARAQTADPAPADPQTSSPCSLTPSGPWEDHASPLPGAVVAGQVWGGRRSLETLRHCYCVNWQVQPIEGKPACPRLSRPTHAWVFLHLPSRRSEPRCGQGGEGITVLPGASHAQSGWGPALKTGDRTWSPSQVC